MMDYNVELVQQVLLMTLQNAPPGLDYERDKRFSKVSLRPKKSLQSAFEQNLNV